MAVATTRRRDTEVKQAEIIGLTREGFTNVDIAEQLGCSESLVRYHVKAWVASKEPPAEVANELRERWGDRLEFAHRANWPQVVAGDAKAIEVMLKIQAQFARLFGLELQPGITVGLFTAEAMAAALGLDPGADAGVVVDAEATEITDG